MDETKIVFKLLYTPNVPVNVGSLTPSTIAGSSPKDLRSIFINIGNKRVKAEEVFDIDCYNIIDKDPANITILFTGKGTEKLWFIGKNMSSGTVVVQGDAGPFAGYAMRGGYIVIHGGAREWLGTLMSGGVIEVYGNVKDFVGAKPFFSSSNGMSGGKIIVHGDAGSFIGLSMSGGYIEILGNAKDFVGLRMKGGVIVVRGSIGVYPALEMVHGLIVIGGSAEAIAPGFYRVELGKNSKVLGSRSSTLEVYIGDGLTGGQGIVILLNGKD